MLEPGVVLQVGLFPLPNVVLFPGMRLPLHVFEPRYKALVGAAIDSGAPLAIPQLEPGFETTYYENPRVHAVCGVGHIVEHTRLADGRFEIVVLGAARVRVVRELSQTPYRSAECEVLSDASSQVGAATLHGELGKLLRELRPFWSEAGERLEQSALGQPTLSGCTDTLAQLFETPTERQQLLEELDPAVRAMMLCARLHELRSHVERLRSKRQPRASRAN